MERFRKLEELMEQTGLSRQEVINYLANQADYVDISLIKSGMFWLEDETFSFELTGGKRVKAIVELVENGVVYGDLTASELLDIKEQKLPWNEAKKFFENFSYQCKENEKIVWYTDEQLRNVCDNYGQVKKAFAKLSKHCRHDWNWTSVKQNQERAYSVQFDRGTVYGSFINNLDYIRPVIALKVS